MEEEAPNKRNEVAILIDHVLSSSSAASPPAPYAAASVFVDPGIASS
jgi:hypothetical protein